MRWMGLSRGPAVASHDEVQTQSLPGKSLSQWMALDRLLLVVVDHVGIDLRGGHAGVAGDLLDGAQRHSGFEQERKAGVSELPRRQIPLRLPGEGGTRRSREVAACRIAWHCEIPIPSYI